MQRVGFPSGAGIRRQTLQICEDDELGKTCQDFAVYGHRRYYWDNLVSARFRSFEVEAWNLNVFLK